MPDIITDGVSPLYLTTYRCYIALISQSDTNAPTAIVLNSNDANYLGDIVWTYDGVGYYVGTLAGAFDANKTFFIIGQTDATQVGTAYSNVQDENSVWIDTTDGSASYDNNVLNKTSLEIRVYP